jgi:hypothetical protein
MINPESPSERPSERPNVLTKALAQRFMNFLLGVLNVTVFSGRFPQTCFVMGWTIAAGPVGRKARPSDEAELSEAICRASRPRVRRNNRLRSRPRPDPYTCGKGVSSKGTMSAPGISTGMQFNGSVGPHRPLFGLNFFFLNLK